VNVSYPATSAPPAAALARGDSLFPFFLLGQGAECLAVIGGGLILDSGEAERTFLYRCQDRFLTYTSLLGLRSVLFVSDEAHALLYDVLIDKLRARLELIAAYAGIFDAAVPAPFYVQCELEAFRVGAFPRFERQLARLRDRDAGVHFELNQISPSTCAILAQLDAALRAGGVYTGFDADAAARAADLALKLHDKSEYVRLVKSSADADRLPRHVPTAVIPASSFTAIASWSALVDAYRSASTDTRPPAGLFVKSASDSSGNVSALLTRETFAARIEAFKAEVRLNLLSCELDDPALVADLRREVEAAPTLRHHEFSDDTLRRWRSRQAAAHCGIPLLIQAAVTPPATATSARSIGISIMIESPDAITPITASAQLYKDRERRQYLGSHMSDALDAAVLTPRRLGGLNALCRVMADRGYRGPLNFDACLDADGDYTFIYDCNPRLTAIYPPHALREALRRAGRAADAVLSPGYRGELVVRDLERCLDTCRSRNLLYTAQRPRGAIVLPNLCREDGYDVLVVNCGIREAAAIVAEFANLAGTEGASAIPEIFH
jgi:hypothetical protein